MSSNIDMNLRHYLGKLRKSLAMRKVPQFIGASDAMPILEAAYHSPSQYPRQYPGRCYRIGDVVAAAKLIRVNRQREIDALPGLDDASPIEEAAPPPPPETIPADLADPRLTPLEELSLSTQVKLVLRDASLHTVLDLEKYLYQGKALESLPNLGKKTATKVIQCLEDYENKYHLTKWSPEMEDDEVVEDDDNAELDPDDVPDIPPAGHPTVETGSPLDTEDGLKIPPSAPRPK